MPKKMKGKSKFPWLWILGVVALSTILVVLGLNWYFGHSLPNRGTFGDMFGASNALFSGIAFAGIVITIWMQKEELSLQRKELSDTRKVLNNQANQLETQSKTLIIQKDENTFFQLLKLHNDIVENLRIEIMGYAPKVGKQVLADASNYMLNAFINLKKNGEYSLNDADQMNVKYLAQYKAREEILGHYFRLLYHIIKFVHHSQLENKRRYTSIVRAQLSQPELVLIYFNCLSDFGRKKFKPLVERYGLLKAMSFDNLKGLGDEELLKFHYKENAFK